MILHVAMHFLLEIVYLESLLHYTLCCGSLFAMDMSGMWHNCMFCTFQAKEMVEGAPVVVKQGLKKEEADKLLKTLIDAGAKAELL